MIILTQESGGTNTAQIRSDKSQGFKVLYRTSSTESERGAAKAVVSKFFGHRAAATVERVPDGDIGKHIPTARNRKRCNPVAVWTFNPDAH